MKRYDNQIAITKCVPSNAIQLHKRLDALYTMPWVTLHVFWRGELRSTATVAKPSALLIPHLHNRVEHIVLAIDADKLTVAGATAMHAAGFPIDYQRRLYNI